MTFLNPSFLWAFALLLVPLALHLFNLHRPRKVYFTNVRYLQQLETQTKAMRKLREWLVLLCRMFFLAALVMAFARPVLPGEYAESGHGQALHSFYIDNSYSMQRPGVGSDLNLLTQAKEQVTALSHSLNTGGRFQLLSNAFDSREAQIYEADELSEALAAMRFSLYRPALGDVLRRQEKLARKRLPHARAHLFLFSDFQKNSAASLFKYTFQKDIHYHLVPLQAAPVANVSIDSVWLGAPFIQNNSINTLYFKLRNHSSREVRQLPVQLFLQDRAIAGKSVDLAAGESRTFSVEFSSNESGWLRGRLHIEDTPITFDNDYYFSYNARRRLQVLYLHAGNEPNPYLMAAYNAEPQIQLQHRTFNTLNEDELREVDLLIVETHANMGGTPIERIRRFVEEGGSLALIPAQGAPPAFLSSWGIQLTQAATLPPDSSLQLRAESLNHPFFEGVFSKKTNSTVMPLARPLWICKGGDAILKMQNGEAFLSMYRLQSGKVYVFAAPLQSQYTSLVKHALFVPVLYRMAQTAPQRALLYAYRSNERSLLLPVGVQPAADRPLSLRREQEEWLLTPQLLGKRLRIDLPTESLQAGFYALTYAADTLALVAFNVPAEESDMETVSADSLAALADSLPNVHVYAGNEQQALVQQYRAQFIATPLWKYFIVAALLFLLCETLIIRLWK
ncbi:MAG: membrane protein [Thermonema sp.]|uniref:BatA domain-containing protein n=1 Tax=Thermonema sp. TaxID=2231181 RepID=UPI0021DC7940|nr:BatA domain-containing protein [Thermonema sp.]GIV40152.1 MAG: membrane protein [Thermonema sp.]